MKIEIKDGVTVIHTGDTEGGQRNKTGARGVTFYEKKKDIVLKSQ